jgi:hypothetical protein
MSLFQKSRNTLGKLFTTGNAKTLFRKIGNTAHKIDHVVQRVGPFLSTIAGALGQPEISAGILGGMGVVKGIRNVHDSLQKAIKPHLEDNPRANSTYA